MTRRRRRSKSYAHERWLTTYYFFKNQVRGVCYLTGAEPVTAGEAFRLGSHAMRIRDHALPPTKNYDTSFFFLERAVSSCQFPSRPIHVAGYLLPCTTNAGTTSEMTCQTLPLSQFLLFISGVLPGSRPLLGDFSRIGSSYLIPQGYN